MRPTQKMMRSMPRGAENDDVVVGRSCQKGDQWLGFVWHQLGFFLTAHFYMYSSWKRSLWFLHKIKTTKLHPSIYPFDPLA